MNKLIILTLSFFTFTLYAQTITDLETEKTNLKNRLSSIENERNNSFKDYQSILSIQNEQLEFLNLSISNIVSSKDSLMVLISKYKVSESNLKSFHILKNEEIVDSKSPKYGSIYKKLIKEFSLLNDQNLIVTPNRTFIIQFDLAGRIDSIIFRIPSAKTIAKQDDLIKKGKLTLLTSETKSAFIYLLTGVNKDYLIKLDELKIVTDSLELLNSKKVKQENKLKDLTKERDQKNSNYNLESEKIIESIGKIENQINELIKIEIQKKAIANSSKIETVKIGTQIWCTRNLDVFAFRNGDTIPEAKTIEEWEYASENKQPVWCYYNFDSSNGSKYGKLYNWYAVNDSRGLAPSGYHVPSKNEWKILESNFSPLNVMENMKSKKGWDSYQSNGQKACPNCFGWNTEYRKKVPCHKCHDTRQIKVAQINKSGNGTNGSGFNALPGGFYEGFYQGETNKMKFDGIGKSAMWWSSTERYGWADVETNSADYYFVNNISLHMSVPDPNKGIGLSVRCIKD